MSLIASSTTPKASNRVSPWAPPEFWVSVGSLCHLGWDLCHPELWVCPVLECSGTAGDTNREQSMLQTCPTGSRVEGWCSKASQCCIFKLKAS